MRVAIIDCGAGNLHSVRKAFAHQLDARSVIASQKRNNPPSLQPEKDGLPRRPVLASGADGTPRNDAAPSLDVVTDVAALADATHIVLPGVGAFADCMNGLNALPGMRDALEEKVLRGGTPFLGICVGMQMLFERGHEHGAHAGLGWFQGEVRAITPADPTLKIPHMGWNRLRLRQSHRALKSIDDGDFVYFVHSYAATQTAVEDVAASVDYGGDIVAMVARANIVATQFHPEKSQRVGLQLISNFLDM